MKFSVISECGIGLGLATHLNSEGHSVYLCIDGSTKLGEGIVPTSTIVERSDIMIFDSNLFGKAADSERELGQRVVGTSHWAELLYKDKEYQQSIIDAIDWNTEVLDKGNNICITAWFNGTHFISSYASFTYNRFMASGKGCEARTSGVVSNFNQPTERVYNGILRPLEPILRRVNHRGCFHVYITVSKDKFMVRSISADFNTPLAYVLFENSKSSVTDILLSLFNESSSAVPTLEPWACAILATVPPFPYVLADKEEYDIKTLETPALKHLWLSDVRKSGDRYTTAGVNGIVGYVTSRGAYIQEASKRAYRTLGKLNIDDVQYRDDIGKGLQQRVVELQEYLWLK